MIFCKHEWEMISELITKSPIELIRETGCTKVTNMFNITERKVIQNLQCKKCGKFKRFVEKLT